LVGGTGQTLNRIHTFLVQDIVAKFECKGLLEHIASGGVLVSEHTLPELVEAAALDEKDWLNRGLVLDDLPDAAIHLLFDPISRFCNGVDRFRVDAALHDQFVCLHFVDGPSLNLFLECEIVPVISSL